MTTLIIARHGNTFEPGEPPRRVGARTDLHLVESGRTQARALGRFLQKHDLLPDTVYCSTLKRTRETAALALRECGMDVEIQANPMFDEIDYGPDEDQLEAKVIERVGEQAIRDWDERGVPVDGWDIMPETVIKGWHDFANGLAADETVLVVTSNGTGRFAPYLTGDYEGFCARYSIKLGTGTFGVLERKGQSWRVKDWNVRP
jgi:probable phosphoglycerate mutase